MSFLGDHYSSSITVLFDKVLRSHRKVGKQGRSPTYTPEDILVDI